MFDAHVDISSLLPKTPNTPFDINVFMNQSNNLDYLKNSDYTQLYTINTNNTIITDVELSSNPSINSVDYQSGVELSNIQLSLTDSLNIYSEDRLQCYFGENNLYVVAIDPSGNYAYFATNNFFAKYATIIKVDLLSFSIVDSLNTPYEYNFSTFALIDPTGKNLYLGCNTGFTIARLFKIDLDTFSFVSSNVFPNFISAGVMDSDGLYMYVFESQNPAKLHKINLITFTIVQTLSLNLGEIESRCMVMDNYGQYLYIGIFPNNLVKIDLNTFTRTSTLTLSSSDIFYGLVDPSGLYIYITTSSPACLKIDLNTFTEIDSLAISGVSFCGSVDPIGKYMYLILYNPGTVIEITLNTFTITNTYTIPSSTNVRCVCIDPSGQYLYTGLDSFPGYIQKIELSSGISLVDTLEGRQGINNFRCGACEQTAQYAYLGSSAGVSKVNLPNWTVAQELGFSASVILMDPNGKYVYFDAVKVDLETQLAVASVSVGNILSAIIDPLGNFAYYGTDTSIIKVNLKTMTIEDSIVLSNPEFEVNCALMDLEGKYAYFGVRLFFGPPPPFYSRIIQVDLKTFTRKAQLDLNEDENVSCAVLDQQGIFGYFGCISLGAQVIRVHLTTLCRVASISLNSSGVRYIKSAVRDPNSSYAYFASEYNSFVLLPIPPLEYIAKVDLDLLQVVEVYNFDITKGIPAAFTTAKAPYVYFGSLDGYLIRIPDIQNERISGLSGNTPGNLVNTITVTDIDYKSQLMKLQYTQQTSNNCYFKLRIQGQTKESVSNDPLVIHARVKTFPK